MVGWCIITSTKSKTKQWDPGFWSALVGFIGLGPSFHPLQNRNLNWAIFERSRGEENKRGGKQTAIRESQQGITRAYYDVLRCFKNF